jgi:hypothetical protein
VSAGLFQDLGVVAQVIGHEALNEVVAMVVAFLHAQGELPPRIFPATIVGP